MADGEKPKVVVAKPIHQPAAGGGKVSNRRLWAQVCYYYPQYDLKAASKLTMRDIKLLLNTAKRIEAERNYALVQIVAAPHTEKGKGVRQLTNEFRKLAGQ